MPMPIEETIRVNNSLKPRSRGFRALFVTSALVLLLGPLTHSEGSALAQPTSSTISQPANRVSQISAMNCMYQAIKSQESDCLSSIMFQGKQPIAITRYDFRYESSGSSSLWLEILAKGSSDSSQPNNLYLNTFELQVGSANTKIITRNLIEPKSIQLPSDFSINEAITESQLNSSVFEWLNLREAPAAQLSDDFVFSSLSGTTVTTAKGVDLKAPAEISSWIHSQRVESGWVEQAVENIRIRGGSRKQFEVSFAVSWRSVDKVKPNRIGRKSYRWEVQVDGEGDLHITRIEIKNSLPLPNMGTRIFC